MIVFAHTKFGLVWIQEGRVKRGGNPTPPIRASFSNPGPDMVKVASYHSNEVCC